jgi:hypothetical protein
MSDFDTVLERLVTDPGFARALAADPNTALAGYRLDADEVALLRSQVSAGDGGDRTVEERTSKASMMGLLGSLGGIGIGHQGAAEIGRELAPHHHAEFAPDGPPDSPRAGFAPLDADPSNPYDDPNPYHVAPAGEAANPTGQLIPGDQPATGYHPHIDADGDGRWDHYTAVRHADGSVDVYEDRNADGRIDFVGHDANGDGILESADYDENFDGHLETHMVDTNGDGWMDKRQVSGQ